MNAHHSPPGIPPILTFEQFCEESRKYWEPPPYISKFKALPWSDLDLPGPEHEWLIKNVMTRGERSMMVGPSQSGKSFLAVDLALAVARGTPWFGNKTVRGGVVYVAAEGGRGVKRRLRAYRSENYLTAEDKLPFVLLPAMIDLYAGNEQAEALILEAKHWAKTFGEVPLELVVIDTLSATTPGADENSSKDIGPVLARCQRIADECRCAVMIVHHTSAAGEKARGHTSITANLDSIIRVLKTEAIDIDRRAVREAETIKQKDGESGKKWRFVLPAIAIGKDRDGDDITSCVVRPPNLDGEPGETASAADAGVKLSPQCEVFLRAIYKALDDYGEPAPIPFCLPQGAQVVDWRRVAEVFGKLSFEDEPDHAKRAGNIRQAMKRHGEMLLSRRIIGREKPYVWLTGRKVRGMPRRGKSELEQATRPAPAQRSADDYLDGAFDDFGGTF
jgi:hypothetical protein